MGKDFTLENATKKEMGYTTESQACETCMFHEEKENPFLDRSWIDQCTYSNLVTFNVLKSAHCRFYAKKVKEV